MDKVPVNTYERVKGHLEAAVALLEKLNRIGGMGQNIHSQITKLLEKVKIEEIYACSGCGKNFNSLNDCYLVDAYFVCTECNAPVWVKGE